MKKLRLYCLGLLSLCALSLSAQDLTGVVYFASGSDSLDAEARAALTTFLQAARAETAGHLQVRAYTDDVDTEAYNLDLAQRRAVRVRQYLADQGLRVNQETIEPRGQLRPEAGLDLAESRRRNRRVDLRLIVFRPDSREAFFEFFRREALQTRTYDPTQDILFEGRKGGRIEIPALSLCDKEGKIVRNPVEIDLIEAYTFEDMILQNLQTVSNEGLLQTGGMVYVEARDRNGQPLELRPGRPMKVSMPGGDRPLPEGMKLFVADRQPQAQAESVVWEEQENAFRERRPNLAPPSLTAKVIEVNFDTRPLEALLVAAQSRQHLPPGRPEPQAPVRPQLKTINLPDTAQAAVLAATPRRKREGKRRYEQRVAQRAVQRKEDHQKAQRTNAANQALFDSQMAQYAQARALYAQDSSDYEAYLDEVRRVVCTWQHTERLATGVWNTYNQLHNHLGLVSNIPNTSKKFTQTYEDLMVYARADSLDTYLAELEALTIDVHLDSAMVRDLAQAKKMLANSRADLQTNATVVGEILIRLGYNYDPRTQKQLANWNARQVALPKQLSHRDLVQAMIRPGQALDLPAIYKIDSLFELVPAVAQEVQVTYQSLAEVVPPLVAAPLAQKNAIWNGLVQIGNRMEKQYRNRMAPILAQREKEQTQLNQFFYETELNNFGWINCDFFLRYNEPFVRVKVERVVDAVENWYVVLPSFRVIVRMDGYAEGFATRIPASVNVRLVGMRVNTKKEIGICILEGQAHKLQRVRQPTFKTASLEEMRLELAKVNN